MQTRYANADDIPEIVRLINLAYRVEDFFVNGDRTTADDIAPRIADDGACIIVVDDSETGRLSGAVCVDVHGERAHFAMLSVDPALQGKGIGRELVSEVERHSRAAGCTDLDLEVVDLRLELPPFYEALGFTRAETVPFSPASKLKREAYLIRMTKPLR